VSWSPKEGAMQRLLVVDDVDASRYATARVLRAAGFETEEAATGREALERVSGKIDLVVLDVNLPDIDGFQVCRELRANRETAEMPIVYLSATFTQSEDIARGMSTGADSYLTHPADPVVLVATVRALLFVKDAHAEKRRADSRFRALFDLAPNGIAMLDASLRFTDLNPALCRLLGRAHDTLVGTPLAGAMLAGQEQKLQGLIECLHLGQDWSGELRVPQPDGATAESEWQIRRDAYTGAYIAVISDVTARRQLETAREYVLAREQAARTEAERSNQLKDEFLATLSHELRNPLNAIIGWAQVLRRTPDLPPEIARGIEAIDRNSRVQSHLIADLLDFAGIRFGKMRLEKHRIDPSEALRAAVDAVWNQAEAKGVQLCLPPLAAQVSLLGDEARLQQVFWNLLTNAIKFTPAGGRVDIATREVDGNFEAVISDTGSGISPEFLPRLFDRFSQQDAGSTKNFGGLGIGLTIVRHLVTMHGGTVSVASEGVGRGARFTVRLPLANDDQVTRPKRTERTLSGVNVLVVEDMEDTRALILRLLGDAGAQVREAASVQEALQAVDSEVPDVLISDIGMPRTDGYQLIRTLRSRGYSAEKLPAVALTAFSRTEDRSDALDAGYQLHVTKPIDAEVLIAAVVNVSNPAAKPAAC
jgi:PAS domain S-box-containing protein